MELYPNIPAVSGLVRLSLVLVALEAELASYRAETKPAQSQADPMRERPGLAAWNSVASQLSPLDGTQK